MSIKSTIAAVAASPFLLAGAAFAGPYVNVESNLGYPDGEYSSTTTDLHLGYEGSISRLDYYIQGGPAIIAVADVDGTENELSGKIGGTYNISSKLGIYGEFSGVSVEDADNKYGTKLGAKFKF